MKRVKYIKAIALCVALSFVAIKSQAQLFPNTYMNIDWQLGVPISSNFADKTSGWGMNFEGGYFLTDNITLGAFISYQTFLESVGRKTLSLGDGKALTTKQEHAIFQLPFGIGARYNWCKESIFQPYAGMKVGAAYSEFSSYYYILKQYTDTWGFYMSPEIGVSIFPSPTQRFGFHVALYYSYATNSGDVLVYSVDNLNNFGVRVGVSF